MVQIPSDPLLYPLLRKDPVYFSVLNSIDVKIIIISILAAVMIGVMVPSAFAAEAETTPEDDYLVDINVTTEKNNFEYGEYIRLKVQMEPFVSKTPLYVQMWKDDKWYAGSELRLGDRDSGDFERSGIKFISILPKNIPTGDYVIKFQYGPDRNILGKQTTSISYTDDNSSIGNQLYEKLSLGVFDIGTDFLDRGQDINPTRNPSFLTDQATVISRDTWKDVSACERSSFNCPITFSQTFGLEWNYEESYVLRIYKFETEEDAQAYASSHRIWEGKPSNQQNYLVAISSSYDNNPKVCFEVRGGYFGIHGVSGLLKCTNGVFVVEIYDRDDTARYLVSSMIDKIDSNPINSAKEEKIEASPTYSYEPTHVSNFPDPTKSPEHYLDRYNNEDAYREWFDSQFPDRTIHDILGIPEPVVNKIPAWVKNVFTWYAQDQISEDEVLNAIKFLVNQGIINLNE